jgi:hypothetical protein
MALFFIVLLLALYISFIAFFVRMAINAWKSQKFLWLAAIICFPIVGSVLYFFIEEKHDYAKAEVK